MKTLDFIVFGMPRSGTTATFRYLNFPSNIICLNELLSPMQDHRRVDISACLKQLSNDPNATRIRRRRAKRQMRKIRKYGFDDVLIGNKRPGYFMRLEGVFEEIGTDLSVCCIRDIPGLMKSFNARAVEGQNWAKGRTGLYAIGEYIVLLKVLARNTHRNILIQPQSALAKNGRETFERVTQHLLGTRKTRFGTAAVNRLVKGGRKKTASPMPEGVEMAAYTAFTEFGLNDLADADAPFLISDISAEQLNRIAALPDDPSDFLRPFVDDCDFAPTKEHMDRFKKVYLKA